MQLGDAYAKVTEEFVNEIARELGVEAEDREVVQNTVLANMQEATKVLHRYTFDGTVKEFVNQRSKKMAKRVVSDLTGEQLEEIRVDFDGWCSSVIEDWIQDLLTMFAMGYSFNGPENKDVPRDKDGFVRLCREVSREVINIQVARFGQDYLLIEQMRGRLRNAAEFMTQVFSNSGRQYNKFTLRDWVSSVNGIVALDCFVVGSRVRTLLEEEAAFEAMMKEMNE